MKSIMIFAAIIGLSYQTSTTHVPHHSHATHTTHLPHASHEPSISEGFIFRYDHITHKMIIHSGVNCYIFTLSEQEKMDVHTTTGLRALEVKLLPMIDSTTKHEVQMSSLEQHIQHLCAKGTLHYYTFQ